MPTPDSPDGCYLPEHLDTAALDIELDELDSIREDEDGSHLSPFLTVYDHKPLKHLGSVFLKGVPVMAHISQTERYTSGSKVRTSTLYSVHLMHGPFQWTIKKKFKHFQELHRDLLRHKIFASLLPLNPLSRFAVTRSRAETTAAMPSLPHVSGESPQRASSKQKHLAEYLNVLLTRSFYRNYHAMMEFLEVSHLSFITDLGPKGLEGFILKRSGGHRIQGLNCFGHHQICYRWSKRWLVVKDSFLLYLKPDSGEISFVLLFDPEFKTQVGKKPTETKYGVRIENYSRTLILKCSGYRQARWWGQQINQLAEDHGKDFLSIHRFGAHAPVRQKSQVKWFVNGSGYFAAVADALLQAREEIFITDWWLSPEIHLKRPATDDNWRLDIILKHKAEAGVRVCVLLFKEVELALGINSGYSKRALMLLHPNIKVMRHPDHVSSIVFLWAHHEKMVAIDQSVVFLGGLDLAYGRWDDHSYRLTDVGAPEKQQKQDRFPADNISPEEPAMMSQTWLGKDYSNLILKDWVQLEKPFEDFIDRMKNPRMPWRDVGAVIHGKAARDASRHFIQRWNFTKTTKSKYKGPWFPYLLPKSLSTAERPNYTVPGCHSATVQVLRSVDGWSAGCNECSILNAYLHCISHAEHYVYIENQFFISSTDGRTVQNTIAEAIVQRVSRAHKEGANFRVFIVIPLLPGFEGNIELGGGNSIQAILHYTYSSICRGDNSIISRLKEEMGDNWRRHLSVCGLRTYGDMPDGSLVTELVYIHSKLLIVDDRIVIIGSANINDRSMLGKRDSELAVMVEDTEFVLSVMDEKPYQAGKFSLSLRMDCFNTVLGALTSPCLDVSDPVSDQFFNEVWNQTALNNAALYDQVFRCLPTNAVPNHRVRQVYTAVSHLASTDPSLSRDMLARVRGHLVEFPLHFLSEEWLLPPLSSKEGVIPTEVWT